MWDLLPYEIRCLISSYLDAESFNNLINATKDLETAKLMGKLNKLVCLRCNTGQIFDYDTECFFDYPHILGCYHAYCRESDCGCEWSCNCSLDIPNKENNEDMRCKCCFNY